MRPGYKGLLVLALFACLPFLRGESAEPPTVAELMHKKLVHSQKVLEGIALNDFERIATNAEELVALSKLAEWRVVNTPQYDLQSNEFRRSAASLVQKAKEKNIDGAALAYVELTLNCVKCHKYVREVRMTRLDGAPSRTGD